MDNFFLSDASTFASKYHMTTATDKLSQETRFTPAAWGVLAFALALLLFSVGQLAYRFTLPTDGWSVYTEEVAETNWIYDANLVGAPSELQPGDSPLIVGGVSVQGTASSTYRPAPPGWEPGARVSVLVQRGSEQIWVEVPVVHWTGLAFWRYNLGELSTLGDSLGALLFVLVGLYAFWRRPGLPSARALLVLSTSIGAASISGLLPDGLSVEFNLLAFGATGFFSYVIFGTLLAPSLLTFTLLFPQPKRILQRRPWLVWLPHGYGLLLLAFLVAGGNAIVGWVGTLILLAFSIASLIHAGFTQRDAVSRAQLRWAISSLVLGIGLFMLNFPAAFHWVTGQTLIDLLSFLASLSSSVIGIGLSVAVLRYRLFDIDVIIRRTLQYTLLTGLLALVYFGSVVILQQVFELVSVGAGRSPLAIVLSTLAIAALFTPLRVRLQAGIDRRFYRRKYDAERTLERFAGTLRDEVDVERLSEHLISVVQETVEPEMISLWVSKTRGKM